MSNAADGFFHVIYPTEALYNIERTADKIVWTYPLVLAVAAWDWLTSLDKERERIWKKPKNVVSILYLLSRYWALADLIYLVTVYVPEIHTWEFCQREFRWACATTIPLEIFSGAILLIRTWAFTGRKLAYLIVFSFLYVTMITYMVVINIIALEVVPFLRIGQTRGRCITAGLSTNQLATGFWVAPLGFCIILTGVSLYHSMRMWQESSGVKRSPLFRVFVRDGLMYLIVITITNTTNVVFFAQKDAALKGSAMAFQFLFSSLMSCRLVLSLRDSEAKVFQHAAASLVTRSYWKNGPSDGGDTEQGGSKKIDGVQSFQLKYQRSNSSFPVTPGGPTSPLEIHVTTEVEGVETDKDSFTKPTPRRF